MMENRTNSEQVLDAFIQSGAGLTDEKRERKEEKEEWRTGQTHEDG